ncbi:hypothetical protein B0H13DRAFT_2359741 [Mycena leptocephala]|nr:hypothetical protein B0H13DRAFT_2359741 [Mycena leptocephala]
MNGRLSYRWILDLAFRKHLKIVGHSDEASTTNSQCFYGARSDLSMDEFTYHTSQDGWIESNICNFVEKLHIIDARKRITYYRTGSGKSRYLTIFPAWLGLEQAGYWVKPRGKLIQFLGLNYNSPAARIHRSTFDSTVPLGT